MSSFYERKISFYEEHGSTEDIDTTFRLKPRGKALAKSQNPSEVQAVVRARSTATVDSTHDYREGTRHEKVIPDDALDLLLKEKLQVLNTRHIGLDDSPCKSQRLKCTRETNAMCNDLASRASTRKQDFPFPSCLEPAGTSWNSLHALEVTMSPRRHVHKLETIQQTARAEGSKLDELMRWRTLRESDTRSGHTELSRRIDEPAARPVGARTTEGFNMRRGWPRLREVLKVRTQKNVVP